MKFTKELEKVGLFYIMSVLYWISIGLMAGYWTLYYTEVGFSLDKIAIILLMYPISAFIFEIPTGIIADILGNKISVFISYFLTGLFFFGIVFFRDNFLAVSILYFLAGISFTFETGALESWFFEYLKYEKLEEYSERLLGRWGGVGQLGFILGTLLSGVVISWGSRVNFILSAVFMLLLSALVLFVGKNYKKDSIDSLENKRFTMKTMFSDSIGKGADSIRLIVKNQRLKYLLLGMIILAFANGIIYNSYQLRVVEIGLPEKYLGFALTMAAIISFVLLNYNEQIVKLLKGNKNVLFLSTILLGINLSVFALVGNLYLIFICLILYTLLSEFAREYSPSYRAIFYKNSKESIRATMISTGSFIIKISEMFGILILGILSKVNIEYLILMSSVIIVIGSFSYLVIDKNRPD